jgi:hypothetical protein
MNETIFFVESGNPLCINSPCCTGVPFCDCSLIDASFSGSVTSTSLSSFVPSPASFSGSSTGTRAWAAADFAFFDFRSFFGVSAAGAGADADVGVSVSTSIGFVDSSLDPSFSSLSLSPSAAVLLLLFFSFFCFFFDTVASPSTVCPAASLAPSAGVSADVSAFLFFDFFSFSTTGVDGSSEAFSFSALACRTVADQ